MGFEQRLSIGLCSLSFWLASLAAARFYWAFLSRSGDLKIGLRIDLSMFLKVERDRVLVSLPMTVSWDYTDYEVLLDSTEWLSLSLLTVSLTVPFGFFIRTVNLTEDDELNFLPEISRVWDDEFILTARVLAWNWKSWAGFPPSFTSDDC